MIKFQINTNTLTSGVTATTINIPISLDFDYAGQDELINSVFVDTETENSINPIYDYETVRFSPRGKNNETINKLTYSLELLDDDGNTTTNYAGIGFTDDDIKFGRENFKRSFLDLDFYDSPNPLTQNLISTITLFSRITSLDLDTQPTSGSKGQIKPVTDIHLTFTTENPILNPRGYSEGYYIYENKNELDINKYKSLYMRASFKNAKTGKITNLMVTPDSKPIDLLVNELYTKYDLVRDTTGYYYQINDKYMGNTPNNTLNSNNVEYTVNTSKSDITVRLYQIKAI